MKNATFLLMLAGATLSAQVGPPPRPVTAEAAKPAPTPGSIVKVPSKSALSRQVLKTSEDAFNAKLGTFNPTDPVYMLGSTRGIYLQGYGAVFSAELDLVQSPTINMFQRTIEPAQVDSIYARKLKQLPVIRKAMIEQLTACAKSLDTMPANEQIVMVVRLDYQPAWEKMAGLPSQILLHADRKSAAAGDIQVEEQ